MEEKLILKMYCDPGVKTPGFKTTGSSGMDIKARLVYEKDNKIHYNFKGVIIDNEEFFEILNNADYESSELFHYLADDFTNHYGTYLDYALLYKAIEEYANQSKKDDKIEVPNNLAVIPPFYKGIIKTGIYVQIPEGYEIQLRPRSGISAKTYIEIMLGTIDEDYRGEIGIIIHNFTPFYQIIGDGDRIGQLVVNKIERPFIVPVNSLDELSNTKRGKGGFGSTGK